MTGSPYNEVPQTDQGEFGFRMLMESLARKYGAELRFDEPFAALLDTPLDELCDPGEPAAGTLGDLIGQRDASFSLLLRAKSALKAVSYASSKPERQVCGAMAYYLCIARGFVTHGAKMTKLETDVLLVALQWAKEQPWIDDEHRSLLTKSELIVRGRRK